MTLFFPEGLDGEVLTLPIMTYATMDMLVQPHIRHIVESLSISDLDYSVWLYSRYTRRSEFVTGNLLIPFDDTTKVVSYSLNDIDYFVFCVTDTKLKDNIFKLLNNNYKFRNEEHYHETN